MYVRKNKCEACPAGTTRLAGDDPLGPDTKCNDVICEKNEKVLNHFCVDCEPGKISSAGSIASGEDTKCEIDYCPLNHYVLDHICKPCPVGQISARADRSGDNINNCMDVFCLKDEYVSSENVCKPCPPGTTNSAGDNPKSNPTKCDDTLCPENYYVYNNKCVKCEPGYISVAGSKASGSNTVCTPNFYCKANEKVVDNICVPCEPGTTSSAGSSSTGPNTSCNYTSSFDDLSLANGETILNSSKVPLKLPSGVYSNFKGTFVLYSSGIANGFLTIGIKNKDQTKWSVEIRDDVGTGGKRFSFNNYFPDGGIVVKSDDILYLNIRNGSQQGSQNDGIYTIKYGTITFDNSKTVSCQTGYYYFHQTNTCTICPAITDCP